MGLLALSAAATLSVALATPAGAFVGTGEVVIAPAAHKKGRTLSGQGVKLAVGVGTGTAGSKLTLPIGNLEFGSKPSVSTGATLNFAKGKKSMVFTDVRVALAAGTVVGKIQGGEFGGTEVPIFWLGAAPQVNGVAGSILLSEGKLRLNANIAKTLKDELGLARALIHKNVGMIWLAAQAHPTHGPAQKVTGGALDWGFLTSWREYIYKNLGPGSVGSITTEGGATTVGEPSKPGSYFRFPASGGSFEQGLFGASDRLSLNAGGSVKFAKPGHCIVEIKFSDIVVTLGSSSSIVADLDYDIDKFNGMGCDPVPPVSAPNTEIAALGSVVPSVSGSTIAWAGLPATLGAAAATPFAPTYKAGHALDPATISVQVEPLPIAVP